MDKKQALIIINPTSGTRNKSFVQKQVKKFLSLSGMAFEIEFTKGPQHATDLARAAAEKDYYTAIAVGGDGTVGETAKGLLHTNTALGIIPIGSGNGLARHLGISTNITTALKALLSCTNMSIDICMANEHPFFNVAGVGFDAEVAHDFAQRPSRGFSTYMQSVIDQWFPYKPHTYQLQLNDEKKEVQALLISIANGSQWGNNAYIAPEAKLADGLMDVCIIKGFPASAIPLLSYQLFNRGLHHSKFAEYHRANSVEITQESEIMHLDGEAYKLGKNIKFELIPKALKVLVPEDCVEEI